VAYGAKLRGKLLAAANGVDILRPREDAKRANRRDSDENTLSSPQSLNGHGPSAQPPRDKTPHKMLMAKIHNLIFFLIQFHELTPLMQINCASSWRATLSCGSSIYGSSLRIFESALIGQAEWKDRV
jgi:hypothetical protein